MILVLLFLSACFLAFSNGANDNFKGVATLWGSGTTGYTGAIRWATLTTLAGSVAALFLARGLVRNFSGKGLVPDVFLQSPVFAISIALGAAITVLLATRIGMPISTTHALVGALVGSGSVAVGTAFNFHLLGTTFLLPLIVSPLVAAVLSLIAYRMLRFLRKRIGVTKESRIELHDAPRPMAHVVHAHTFNGPTRVAAVRTEQYAGTVLGVNAQRILDGTHYATAGVVSFARGLNDTPKIVGLLVVIQAMDIEWGMIAVALAMAVGGLTQARKVGELMSHGITPMNSGQGSTANLVTGLLVTTASVHGLPVSTTHVSVGSIFGIGTVTGKADLRVIKHILLSWLLTLPIAGMISGLVYALLISVGTS